MESSSGRPHRVVIVGCGFGGLFAARELRRAPVELTVIDRTNHHLFQPLLYQMATGILSEGDIAPPIRDVLRKQKNTRVLLGEVVDVDPGRSEVVFEMFGRRQSIGYDSLIVATGASQSYFGKPELAAVAPGMKSIDDALEIRGRIFGAFELAEEEPDPVARRALLTFVVVGGGPTGVEMAGQIAELSRRSLGRNFRTIDPSLARVVLIEAGSHVLDTFHDSLRRSARRGLEALGVELRLGVRVTGIDRQGVDTNSDDPAVRRIEARTKIWAAGVEASPLGKIVARATGASTDRAGRIEVAPDCTIPGHPVIFVVGDLMSLDRLPGVAEVAMQGGVHAARTIERRLRGDTVERPFHYVDLGNMATVSRFRAVAEIGRLRVGGFIGWLLWLFVHLMFLTGFKNRVAVLFNWIIAFLGRGRPQRTITIQQVLARRALAEAAARRAG